MKISTREVVLLIALFVLLMAGAYYLLFFVPNSNEASELQESINSKNAQIDNASIMLLRRQSLVLQKEALEKEFAGVAKYVHEDFGDTDILRRIENIITPYTDTMNIEFANRNSGSNNNAGLTSVRTVQVSLNTSHSNLNGIIKAFEQEDAANRIVNFSVSGNYSEYAGTSGQLMRVNISVDYLSR